jgi:hypothetical protein
LIPSSKVETYMIDIQWDKFRVDNNRGNSRYFFHSIFRSGCNVSRSHAPAKMAAAIIGMDPCSGQNSKGMSALYIVIMVHF